MTDLGLVGLTIAELAPKIESREISPVEVTEAALAQAERLQPKLNSFITILGDQALTASKAREKAIGRGEYRGPLDGIPIGVKDNIATEGVLTTAGSKVLGDFIPEEDAEAVRRCREAGAIIIGKENLPEFAGGGTSENPHFGPVHNPWDLERIPGGSSGGGGANVAACVTFASLGTDIGGSIRIPAAYCGVVGMKATYGRVSLRGILATTYNGDHLGALTRTVRDNAIVLNIIAGNDPLDPSTVPVSVPDYTRDLDREIGGVRIGVPTSHYFDFVDDEVNHSVQSAIASLAELGATIQDVHIEGVEHVELMRSLMSAENFLVHEEWLRERRHLYGEQSLARMLAGQFALATDYAKVMKLQRFVKEGFTKALQEVDVIVTPTMNYPPRRIGAETTTISGQEHTVKGAEAGGGGLLYLGRNTGPSNRTGFPSMSVNCGFTSNSLPIGLQLIGRPFEEELLYRVAQQYTQAAQKDLRHPPVAVP